MNRNKQFKSISLEAQTKNCGFHVNVIECAHKKTTSKKFETCAYIANSTTDEVAAKANSTIQRRA